MSRKQTIPTIPQNNIIEPIDNRTYVQQTYGDEIFEMYLILITFGCLSHTKAINYLLKKYNNDK